MTASTGLKMTVNVSLCGSIPRSQMMSFDQPRTMKRSPPPEFPSLLSHMKTSDSPISLTTRRHRKTSISENSASSSVIEPPKWAVPAIGEAKLEPIGVSKYAQSPVDLSLRASTTFGRSQSMDVQLLNETSSRRHAILFHHPNGSCYVVDCGSAHGTFVNGVRVKTHVLERTAERRTGTVIPYRVKKGSIIRFGGVGAPSFILKAFSTPLENLIKDAEESETKNLPENLVQDDSDSNSEAGMEVNDKMVALNTRLNAMGESAMREHSCKCLPSLTRAKLSTKSILSYPCPNTKTRSLSSVSDLSEDSIDMPQPQKKRRISQETLNTETVPDLALISPSRYQPTFIPFDISSIDRPVVSPNPLDEGNILDLDPIRSNMLAVPMSLSMESTKPKRRVQFSDKHEYFYPPSVTPEQTSDTEGY